MQTGGCIAPRFDILIDDDAVANADDCFIIDPHFIVSSQLFDTIAAQELLVSTTSKDFTL